MPILISDIDISMQNFATFYRGNSFKGYSVANGWKTGGFCATFKISGGGNSGMSLNAQGKIVWANQRHYAYRVPHAINANLAYQQDVIDHLKQINSSYFVEFGEETKSLLVDGNFLDVTYMEWIEGLTLADYIQANYADKTTMINLANNFLTLTQWLHDNQISHGDLNDSNIMVRPDGSLVLIDYDTLCFANIEGKYNETSVGKANYQHPSRMQGKGNKLSLKADYFSEVVIYLSILALAENSQLFNYVSVGDSLLCKKEDFTNFAQSNIYHELAKLSPRVKMLANVLEFYLGTNDYLQLPSLTYVWSHVAQDLSLTYDSWFDELIAWADEFGINLPRNKQQLLAITNLNISGKRITYLPDAIGNLTNLQQLSCFWNKLTSLPDAIGNLTNLKYLYCGGNQLTSLPEAIGNLTNLQYLYCYDNQLTSLPDAIGNLTNLQKLYCNVNPLTSLPDAIGNLTKLTNLRCDQVVINNLHDNLRKIART